MSVSSCYTAHRTAQVLDTILREVGNGKCGDNKFQHLSAGPFLCTWRQGVYWDKVDLQWCIINSLWYVPGDGYLPPRHTATAAFSPGENRGIKPEQIALRGKRTAATKKKKLNKMPDANYNPSVLLWITGRVSPISHLTAIMNRLPSVHNTSV